MVERLYCILIIAKGGGCNEEDYKVLLSLYDIRGLCSSFPDSNLCLDSDNNGVPDGFDSGLCSSSSSDPDLCPRSDNNVMHEV